MSRHREGKQLTGAEKEPNGQIQHEKDTTESAAGVFSCADACWEGEQARIGGR